eukprot:1192664-Prorocentrum_minimum.AAC.1
MGPDPPPPAVFIKSRRRPRVHEVRVFFGQYQGGVYYDYDYYRYSVRLTGGDVAAVHLHLPVEVVTQPEHLLQRRPASDWSNRENIPTHPASDWSNRKNIPTHPASDRSNRENIPTHPAYEPLEVLLHRLDELALELAHEHCRGGHAVRELLAVEVEERQRQQHHRALDGGDDEEGGHGAARLQGRGQANEESVHVLVHRGDVVVEDGEVAPQVRRRAHIQVRLRV